MSSQLQSSAANPWAWQPQQPAYARLAASVIRLEGSGSRRFLHGQTSAAIEGAGPGQWIPSCCISPTGRMRALVEVLVDAGGAWLLIGAGDGAQVHQAFDRVLFPADQVRLAPPQPAWWLLPVAGAGETLPAAAASPDKGSGWQALGGSWQSLGEGAGWQLGEGPLGQALVLLDGEPLPPAWASRQPLNAAEQEHWRLQQGLPAVPGELNDDHNPFELGLAPRVSLNKGCYVGQETLAKLATYDGVKQQLRRWHWTPTAAGQAPELGQELRSPGGEGRLGRISSMLELSSGDRIGLALVRRQGLELTHLQAGRWEQAEPRPATLALSVPAQFVAPPVGAGGAQP
jgi:tRNA-modifying protein YgfZ